VKAGISVAKLGRQLQVRIYWRLRASRRQFLKGSTAAMGGLMVGAWLPPFAPKSAAATAVATQKGAYSNAIRGNVDVRLHIETETTQNEEL
jgi:anaerobic selenocysteine-containing dehydrogenase